MGWFPVGAKHKTVIFPIFTTIEEQKARRYSLCNLLHYPIHVSLSPNTF